MDSARTAPFPSVSAPEPQQQSSFHRFRHSQTSQMSRRDRDSGGRDRYDRDGGSRHRRSGFDREPSPKRSRKDEKPESEQLLSRPGSQRQPINLQDAVPVGVEPGRTESKSKSPDRKKESEKKSSEDHARDAPSSEPAVVPRSRSDFQHDDNRKAGQVGRGFVRRATNDRGWRDSKDDRRERAATRSVATDSHERDRKSNTKGDDNSVWRPPVRRRPSFREQKIPVDSENGDKPAIDSNRSSQIDRPVSGGERRDGRDRYPRNVDRLDRNRGAFLGRDRGGYGGVARSNYVGRESFNGGRQSYHPQSGRREEKWKHDLFDDATKSPTTKNDDDQIARVEALLAS